MVAALVLTGAPGAGKTSVLLELGTRLEIQGVRYGAIETVQLTLGPPILPKIENQRGEEGEAPQHSTLEATLTFKSAKLVVVKVHLLNEGSGEVSCDGNGSWNVQRQS